jgi:hypothetical protein
LISIAVAPARHTGLYISPDCRWSELTAAAVVVVVEEVEEVSLSAE